MKPARGLITAIATFGGIVLFIIAVQRAGVGDIVEGIRRVGWGLLLILAIGGARFMLRAECWRRCMPPPSASLGTSGSLTFPQAFAAFLAGDAVGTITPLGLVASEPTKVFLTRHQLATRESVASLALENLVYTASVGTVVSLGIAVLLATVPLPPAWRTGLLAALALGALGAVVVAVGLRAGAGSFLPRTKWRAALSGVRQQLRHFTAAAFAVVYALDLVYHALAVFEVYITLEWLLGDRSPTLAQSVIFEALNRVVTVVFKFVPFRVGIDELLTGGFAPLVGVTVAAGVTLTVIRKVRNLFWAAVGLVIVATHPARS